MNEEITKTISNRMRDVLSEKQLLKLEAVVHEVLSNIKLECETENIYIENQHYLKMFLSAKKIEGCSEKTIFYYGTSLEKMINQINKNICQITTEDLRIYLADYQQQNNTGRTTIDNLRRIISAFYSWMEDENYIPKSPARRIRKIKTTQTVKDTFTDENLETLRNACVNIRDMALLEFLASTGVRVGELVRLNREDINFQERSCVVLGKGDKEREVYFDARTKLHLRIYLETRKDDNEALFVSLRQPHSRLSISGVEKFLKRIEKQTSIKNVHPHKFRRTLATIAIDKGMPVEQVQKLLGHVRIDTTMHYAMVNQTNVKNAHRKYIG